MLRALSSDPASLWTPELLLVPLNDVEAVFGPEPAPAWSGPPDSFNTYNHAGLKVIDTVAERRAEALRTAEVYPVSPARDLAGWTLLAFNPMTTQDGGTEYCSGGFFNRDDEPPWDTWLWFVNEPGPTLELIVSKSGAPLWADWSYPYVVSWVPPQFVDAVRESKDMTSLGTIQWLDLIDDPFTRRLRRLGILDPTRYP